MRSEISFETSSTAKGRINSLVFGCNALSLMLLLNMLFKVFQWLEYYGIFNLKAFFEILPFTILSPTFALRKNSLGFFTSNNDFRTYEGLR